METHLRTALVPDALRFAVQQRQPTNVIHHSDQGCQYTSIQFGLRCKEAGVRPSTGSVGNAYDNAMAESIFATLECGGFRGKHRGTARDCLGPCAPRVTGQNPVPPEVSEVLGGGSTRLLARLPATMLGSAGTGTRLNHPSRPRARTCCFFSSLKTLAIPAADHTARCLVNVPAPYISWPV